MKRYLRNLWLALIGSPDYRPSDNIETIILEADTDQAVKAIDDLRSKIEALGGVIARTVEDAEKLRRFTTPIPWQQYAAPLKPYPYSKPL